MENKKDEIMEIEEVTEMTVVENESKFKKTLSNVGKGIKKHKKKIIAGAAIVGGAILTAVLLGKKANNDSDYITDIDADLVEVDDTVLEDIEIENN